MKRLLIGQALAFFAVFIFIASGYAAENTQRFQTTANGADVITPIGGPGVFGIGFYADTTYPLSRPYSARVASGSQEDMRFQVPVGFGLEASYGITRHMEAALSFGYDNFKTQQFTNGSGTSKTFDVAEYQLFPVMGIFRYRFPRRGWAPEAEAAVGAAFGGVEVRETKTNGNTIKDSGPYWRGHLAGGAGFSWAESASLHFLIGYGFNHLGDKTYDDGSTLHVEQKGNLQGVFSKAYLKFYF